MQIRVVSGKYLGLLSPHKSLGNCMILLAALLLALRDSQIRLYLDYFFYSGCRTVLPLPPPVDIQTSCDLVVWRNAPNISYEDITGYEIQFLINSAAKEEVNISLDASATFYSLDKIEDETLKHESTLIQVIIIQLGLHY